MDRVKKGNSIELEIDLTFYRSVGSLNNFLSLLSVTWWIFHCNINHIISLPSRYCVVIGFIFSLNPHSLLYVFVNNLSRFFLSNNQWNYDKFTNNLSTNRNYVGLVVAVLFPVLIFWRNPSHCHSHRTPRCHNSKHHASLILTTQFFSGETQVKVLCSSEVKD